MLIRAVSMKLSAVLSWWVANLGNAEFLGRHIMVGVSIVRSILTWVEAADLAQHFEAAPLGDNVALDEALQALVDEEADVNFAAFAGDYVKDLADDFTLQFMQLRV